MDKGPAKSATGGAEAPAEAERVEAAATSSTGGAVAEDNASKGEEIK